MRLKKLALTSLAVSAALALSRWAIARRAPAQPVTQDNEVAENGVHSGIDAYIETHLRHMNLPGAAFAIVQGSQIVHWHSFGHARPGGEAPSLQTPFFIGSLTKSFTALAIMQLVEAGQVDLDAPVRRYLPWFRVSDTQASARITVRHLLNHTSGIPQTVGIAGLGDLDASPEAAERQARALVNVKLAHPVGSTFDYCNTNYNLLGLIVETASGEPYPAYIQRHIFDPLGMRHSYTSKAAAQSDNLAMGHLQIFGLPVAAPGLPVPIGSLPSGQLISTAEDMAHYLIAYLNDGCYQGAQVISPASIAEMHRPAVDVIMMGKLIGHYGMGWSVEGMDGNRRVFHKGTVPDFFAFMGLLPQHNQGFVLLINANNLLVDFTLADVGAGILSLLAGEQPKPVHSAAVPWIQRSALLIPLIQVAGILATLRRLRRWRRDPDSRPSRQRLWGQHLLLPLLPNLSLAAIPLALRFSGLLRAMLLFLPDFAWTTFICGSISATWAFLRSGLMLSAGRQQQ